MYYRYLSSVEYCGMPVVVALSAVDSFCCDPIKSSELCTSTLATIVEY